MCICMNVLYVCIRAYICTIYKSALSCFKIKRFINVLCYVMLYKSICREQRMSLPHDR